MPQTTDPRRAGAAHTDDLPSFGRRRGRKLSNHQTTLRDSLLTNPAFDFSSPAPRCLTSLFPVPVNGIWLEIGFGGGEHLLWQARNNPGTGFIAAEPYIDGVVKTRAAITSSGITNILIHPDDARPLLRWLPEGCIARTFILHPDPWPKRRHVKRRLLQPATLALLARLMPPDAELRIATDIGDYARTILLAVAIDGHFEWRPDSPQDWRNRPADWPETRYGQKACAAGRPTYHLQLWRK